LIGVDNGFPGKKDSTAFNVFAIISTAVDWSIDIGVFTISGFSATDKNHGGYQRFCH